MNMDEILTLVQAVSDSKLTSFKLDQGDMHISLKKEKKEGDTVKKGQVLGIIEAMKLMNEIESEYDGVIEAILVNNEEVVEYGQPLFRIK